MELILEKLPFPGMAFHHWALDDREMGVVLVKGTFGIRAGRKAFIAAHQEPLLLEDTFAGDPASSPLLREQEIAPAKVATDVTMRARARSVDGRERPDWRVSIAIADRLHHDFHVFGPRFWRRSAGKWSLSDPEPMSEMPIDYRHAYGGASATEAFEENPAGCGHVVPDGLADDVDELPAPRIAELADAQSGRGAPAHDETWAVRGFGPVAKAWMPRRAFAGTFDEEWLAGRHPRMPSDYSFEFWQSAPAALQVRPFLRGDEAVELTGVRHDREPYRFALPGPMLEAARVDGDGRTSAFEVMSLDTCHIDVEADAQEGHTLTLLWRMMVPDPLECRQVLVRTRQPEA